MNLGNGDHIRWAQIVVHPIFVLKSFHHSMIGKCQNLVHAASGLFDLASLPPCVFLYRPLVSLSPDAREVIVISCSPLAPGEGVRPPAPRIGGFQCMGIIDMSPVSA